VDGQEPELLNASGTGGSPYRLNGDNVVNSASADLHTDWTRLFSTDLTYGNVFADYSQSGVSGTQPGFAGASAAFDQNGLYQIYSGGVAGVPSYAGSLNRDQNSLNLDLQWHLAPQTIIEAGYQFQLTTYTGDELIGFGNRITGTGPGGVPYYNGYTSITPPTPYYSDSRDNMSHIVYVGVTENLLDSLVAAGRVGFQVTDDYNDPLHKSTEINPYVNLSLIYTYLPDCTAQLGFTQSRNATDVVSVSQQNGSLTLDQESSTLFASVNHHITSKFLVSVIGRYSDSVFNGGAYDGGSDTEYNLGVTANYAFTKNFSANVNYNYDDLLSPIDSRGYARNRISIGVSVAY
jgi:hypothetical protein